MPHWFQKERNRIMGVLVLQFLLVAFWTVITPRTNDDLTFATISSAKQLFNAGVHDYFYWNGRFFGQTFARLLDMMSPVVSGILSAAAFVGFNWLMAYLSVKAPNKVTAQRLMLVFCANIIWIPAFGDTVLWRAGAGNYLWVGLFILGLLAMNKAVSLDAHQTKHKLGLLILSLPIGLIAGWSNENSCGGCILALLGLFVLQRGLNKQPIQLWQYTGMLTLLIGTVFLIKAPGNAVRAALFHQDTLKVRLITGTFEVSQSLLNTYMVAIVVVGLALVYGWFHWQADINAIWGGILLVSGIAIIGVLLFAPMSRAAGRSWFMGIVFIIIAFFSAIPENQTQLFTKRLPIYLTLAFGLVAAVHYVEGSADILLMRRVVNMRYTAIQQQKAAGKKVAVVAPYQYHAQTGYAAYMNWELLTGTGGSPNYHYQDYFKIKVALQK